jgi:hypothetical protein
MTSRGVDWARLAGPASFSSVVFVFDIYLHPNFSSSRCRHIHILATVLHPDFIAYPIGLGASFPLFTLTSPLSFLGDPIVYR